MKNKVYDASRARLVFVNASSTCSPTPLSGSYSISYNLTSTISSWDIFIADDPMEVFWDILKK